MSVRSDTLVDNARAFTEGFSKEILYLEDDSEKKLETLDEKYVIFKCLNCTNYARFCVYAIETTLPYGF